MKKSIIISTFFVLCFNFSIRRSFAQTLTSAHIKYSIESKVLNEKRDILIHLPENYEKNSKLKYPVLYMLDGEGINPQMMAIIIAQQSRNLNVPQMILVSIPNTNRTRDLTPTSVEEFPTSGGGDKFLDFVEKEIFPLVEKKYRTHPYRILAGHSFGGLTAIHAMMSHPQMFNAYISASPALFWDNNLLIREAENLFEKKDIWNKRLFVGLGDEPQLIKEFESYQKILKQINPKGLDYEFRLIPNENHGTAILLEYYYGLKKIYEGWSGVPKSFPLPKNWLEELEKHYDSLASRYEYKILIPEELLNGIGYGLLYQEKRIDEAIKAFKKNVEIYPDSPNSYDSLGEGYELKGKFILAKINYEKAFKIAEQKGNNELAQTARANYERVKAKIK